MGFKIIPAKEPKNTPQEPPRPQPRRCYGEAVEIMQKYSERIEDQKCREDLKALLKKCLFKMVAAESVEQEIGFLSEMRRLLQSASKTSIKPQQFTELQKLVRELYEIAVDKSIDQHYHKSSKHIDHLNVLDDHFRLYALSILEEYHTGRNQTEYLLSQDHEDADLEQNQQEQEIDDNEEYLQEQEGTEQIEGTQFQMPRTENIIQNREENHQILQPQNTRREREESKEDTESLNQRRSQSSQERINTIDFRRNETTQGQERRRRGFLFEQERSLLTENPQDRDEEIIRIRYGDNQQNMVRYEEEQINVQSIQELPPQIHTIDHDTQRIFDQQQSPERIQEQIQTRRLNQFQTIRFEEQTYIPAPTPNDSILRGRIQEDSERMRVTTSLRISQRGEKEGESRSNTFRIGTN